MKITLLVIVVSPLLTAPKMFILYEKFYFFISYQEVVHNEIYF